MEQRLAKRPKIEAPTIVLSGGADGLGRPNADITQAEREVLPKILAKRVVEGAGHFVPHEKPEPVAAALLEVLTATK